MILIRQGWKSDGKGSYRRQRYVMVLNTKIKETTTIITTTKTTYDVIEELHYYYNRIVTSLINLTQNWKLLVFLQLG